MKHKYIIIMSVLLFFSTIPVYAQNALYKPFTSFRVIKTEHFDIIFPKESEISARTLASYADDVYRQISGTLGIEVPGRIYVTFAPHTDLFNGYFNQLKNNIVLYDTPMDIEWNTYANNLKGLFVHELTHAVSLNSRTPFFKVLYNIFGIWASPRFFNAPLFMVEGVTVSFESLDGYGRANDPRIKQYLRQAVHEGKFLTPFQASGVYDKPMQPSGYYYEYGGLFSAWLQQTYGMEKYSKLWQEMGGDSKSSFSVYKSDFYSLFKNVYHTDFLYAWNAFRTSLALENLETNNDELLSTEYRYFSEKEHFIDVLSTAGNNLFFIDNSQGNIGVYNTETGVTRSLNSGSLNYTYDLDISDGGETMLLSGYRYIDERYTAAVTEHRTGSGIKTGRAIDGLFRARYFRNGVVGLRSNLHNTNIVYEDFDGKSEILLSGNDNLMFSGPQVLDDNRIAFIISRNGIRELCLYNFDTRELFQIETDMPGNKYWRNLSVSEGKLFFSHNADDRMYKLGSIDLETMQAVFSARDFSGGVFYPVCTNDTIYYLGSFVSRDSLLRFPESADSLSGNKTNLRLINLDTKNFEVFEVFETPVLAQETQTTLDNETAQTEPVYLTDEPRTESTITSDTITSGTDGYSGASKKYHSLLYIDPFQFWIPAPLVRFSTNESNPYFRVDGGGFLSIITEPTDRNLLIILAYADIYNKMANVAMFTWQNYSLGIPLTLDFSDTVIETADETYRATNINLTGSLSWGSGQWNNGYFLGAGYSRSADYENNKGAYEWKETESGFYFQTGVNLSYRRIGIGLSAATLADSFTPRVDAVLRANTDTRFPLSFTLFGAYDKQGMNLHGISKTFNNMPVSQYALKEFPAYKNLNLTWLFGGEAAVGLFSVNVQKHISHIYFNKFFGTLSFRNQLYDSNGLQKAEGVQINDLRLAQSLGLKLGMKISALPFVKMPFSIEPFVFGAWKFSGTITGIGFPWYASLGFNVSF